MKRSKLVRIVAVILAILMALSLVISVIPYAFAKSSSEIKEEIEELKKKKEEITEEKEALQDQIDALASEQTTIIEQKAAIDQQMNITLEEIDNTNALIEQYNLLIDEKEQEVEAAQADEAELYELYKIRLREMEENGSASYVSIIFGANSFSDLLERIDWIAEISAADKKMMAELSNATAAIQDAQQELEMAQAEQREQADVLAEQQDTLEEQSAQAQILIDQYSEQSEAMQEIEDKYYDMELEVLQQIKDSEAAYQKAKNAEEEAARIKAAEEAARKAASSGGSGNSGSGSGGSSGGGSSSVSFIRPVSGGYISSPYGMRMHPIYHVEKMHYGVDYAVSSGTPVKATASGTVTLASYDSSCGNWVKISHQGGYASAYMHLSSYCVSVGQTVVQGQVIGYVGSTGASTGPHLHFAMYYNGSFVNPANYVGSS